MKRTLSLLLALVLVLGTFSTVFAAMPETDVEKAELLKELGVLVGDNSGDLMLDEDLNRAQAVVLLSRLMKAGDVAKEFPVDDLPFDDVTDPIYPHYVAWAVANDLTQGISATKFDPEGDLTAQQFATFLLRALGYEIDAEAYETAFETAEELGIFADLKVEKETVLKRKDMAVMTFNVLYVPMKDTEVTLGEYLELELPEEEPVLSTDIEITAAKAIANNKVEVSVKEEVEASLVDFAIVEKGTNNEVEIKDLVKESAKVFVLETEALTAGKAYTVKSNGKELNFTGIAVDKTAPTVKSVKGTDTNRFEVEFSDVMDKVTAEDVENYEFNKELKVVSATLKSNRKVVVLETDAAKKNTTYKLTVENVTNSDGVAMKKSNHNVRAIEWTKAPTVAGTPRVLSNTLVEIKFNAEKGMNKESLEAVENYTIEGLEVLEAKAYDLDSNGLYETVLLTTEDQEANKTYKLTISGVTDNSVLSNVLKTKTFNIRGYRADRTPPSVVSVDSGNGNEVKIEFNDISAMDVASMTDISNYKITYREGGDTVELAILEAEAWAEGYPYAYNTDLGSALRGVTLTTEEQIDGRTYAIEISNIADEYGNEMKQTRRLTFRGSKEDLVPPTVKSVEHTGSAIKIVFNESLNKAIAQDPTNYTIDGVGSAIKATTSKKDFRNDTVTLETGSLTANKSYKLTIENIEDVYGNIMPTRTVSFIALASSLDTTAPSLSYAYAENSKEVHLNFDEVIDDSPNEITNVGGLKLERSGTINDGTTVVYKVTTGDMKNQKYEFPANTEFKDASGNKVDIQGETFYGIEDSENFAPEIEFIEQIDPRTVNVYFNEPVELTWSTPAVLNNYYPKALDISSLDTHGTEWQVRFDTALQYDKVNNFTFTATDLGGAVLEYKASAPYEFTADYYDDEAPFILDVEAVDKVTVKVTYNEELGYKGSYNITDEDDKAVPVSSVDLNGNVVTIKVGRALEAEKIYTLKVLVGARDLTNKNTAETGVWGDFVGSNIEPIGQYITGVALINANKIKVNANFSMNNLTVSGDVYETVQYSNNNTVATVTTKIPFLAGEEYTVKDGTAEYKFKGLVKDLGIDLENVTGGYKVVYDGIDAYDEPPYNVVVLNAEGNEVNKVSDQDYYNLTAGNYYVVLKDLDTDAVLYAAKVSVE